MFDDNPQIILIDADLNITELNDVNVDNVTNGQILIWNSTTLQWENGDQNVAGDGGGGRTYTGIPPIIINNDANQIGLNVTPTTDWNGLFDGNDSTFYIDWTNSVNRLFSLLELDDNSSFDNRYLPHLLRTYEGIAPITVNNDANQIGLNVSPSDDWNGLFDGNDSSVYRRDANFVAKGILSVDPRYLSIDDGHLDFDTNTQDLLHFFDGTILETINVDVNSDGTDVNLFVGRQGGGDLTLVFNDGYFFFDTTPPQTITLNAGSNENPQSNFVYIPNSTQVLTISTVGFPTDAEFAPIGTFEIPSAARVVIDGAYKVHVWTDHSDDEDTHQGHESHVNSWIRTQPATWRTGVLQTLTITSNAGRPDNVDFAVTSGTVLQLHLHDYPAFDTAIDSNIFVVNDSVAAFTKIDDLNALLTDSTGGSMSNRYFTLVVWGVVSEDAKDSKLFVNLPSGSYNKQSDAIEDVSNFDNFNIPIDFVGAGFLISKLVLRHQPASGGTWTSIQETDLRGLFPSISAAGGSGAAVTSFSDNLFEIFNVTDSTKLLNFDLSDMATATTATWTVPSRDINFAAPVFDDLNVLEDTNLNRLTVDGNSFFNSRVDINGFGTGNVLAGDGEIDLFVGVAGAGSGGCIQLGDYQICDTGNIGVVGDLNMDDFFIIRDMDGDSNISFMFITPGNLPRFIIPREGVDFATNNIRSLILGGDIGQALDDDIILCSANGYNRLACNTDVTGADFGVQNDAQIRGTLYVDENATVLFDVNSLQLCLSDDCINAWADVNNGTPHILRTYTGIAPITVDNDSNQVGLDVTPTTDWNGLFDGNDSTFYIDWTNSVNRNFSFLDLDDNSSFDERYNLTADTNNMSRIMPRAIAGGTFGAGQDYLFPSIVNIRFLTAPDGNFGMVQVFEDFNSYDGSNLFDVNIGSGIISVHLTEYSIADDLNKSVLSVCSGDANSVWATSGCIDMTDMFPQDISGFVTESDGNVMWIQIIDSNNTSRLASNVIALPPWLLVSDFNVSNFVGGTFGLGDFIFPADLNILKDLNVLGKILGAEDVNFEKGLEADTIFLTGTEIQFAHDGALTSIILNAPTGGGVGPPNTVTLPNISGTVMLLSGNQTVTGTKTWSTTTPIQLRASGQSISSEASNELTLDARSKMEFEIGAADEMFLTSNQLTFVQTGLGDPFINWATGDTLLFDGLALSIDAGRSIFWRDRDLNIFSPADSVLNISSDQNVVMDTNRLILNGFDGGCLAVLDTDEAGYTFITTLNGVVTGSTTPC